MYLQVLNSTNQTTKCVNTCISDFNIKISVSLAQTANIIMTPENRKTNKNKMCFPNYVSNKLMKSLSQTNKLNMQSIEYEA